MEAILPKQPTNYSRLIKTSFSIYKKGFSRALVLSFLFSFTVFIPRLISVLVGQDLFLNVPPLSPHRLWLVVIDLASLLFFVGVLWRTHCVIIKKHEPLAEDLSKGTRKLFACLIAGILQCAILFGVSVTIYGVLLVFQSYQLLFQNNLFGLIFTTLVFFGQLMLILYVATLFFFTIPLITIEDNHIFRALERSILLAWNHWWRVFSVQTTPWLVYLVLLIVIRYVFHIDIHLYFIDHGPHKLWATLLHIIIFALYIPWVASLLLVQLNDLELRKKLVKSTKSK